MGLFGDILGLIQKRRATKPQRLDRFRLHWPFLTRSGVKVNEDIALTYSAVWSCVRIISETLAAMPWHIHEKTESGRQRVEDHSVDALLNVRANPEMTAFDFKQTVVGHVLTWGNGYAEIDRMNNSEIAALWPLPPDRVEPERDEDGRLVYIVKDWSGGETLVPANRMLHLRGLGFDGVLGYSVIQMAAQSIGLGMATERFGSEFFGNGAHPGFLLKHPDNPSEAAIDNMKASFLNAAGTGSWLSPVMLEEGVEVERIGIPPEDAQFLETRKFQTAEVARWYRVPPHKLADLERATFSNIEHQSIEFVTDTILPWAVRFEQEVNRKLLPRQPGVYSRINLDGLLRGDIKSRYEAYGIGVDKGWLTRNDVRRFEDLNPVSDENADKLTVQAQMVPLDKIGEEPEPMPMLPAEDGDENGGVNRALLERMGAT